MCENWMFAKFISKEKQNGKSDYAVPSKIIV